MRSRYRFAVLAMLILCLKTVLYLWDGRPMFFLGDSGSYIQTALTGWIPPDRSFTYGFFVRLTALWPESLASLVSIQSWMAGLICLALFFVLTRFFRVRFWLAAAIALLCAVEPIQLLYERFVLTETLALFLFSATLIVILFYLEKPALHWLIVFQLLGIALVSVRFSWFPFVLGLTLLMPLIILQSDGTPAKRGQRRRVALHYACSIVSLLLLHAGYRALNGSLSDKPAAYLYADGFFEVAAVTPLIRPSDGADETVRQILVDPQLPDLKDPFKRDQQRWMEGGLVDRLVKQTGNELRANALAKQTARNTMLRDPVGLLRLGWTTYLAYWNPEIYPWIIHQNHFLLPLPPGFLQTIEKYFHLDASGYAQLVTPSKRYYRGARIWFLVVLCVPLLVLIALLAAPARQKPGAGVLFLAAGTQLAVVTMMAVALTYRFLHPLAWIALLSLGILIEQLVELNYPSPKRQPPPS